MKPKHPGWQCPKPKAVALLGNHTHRDKLPLLETYRAVNRLNQQHGTSLSVIRPHTADALLNGWRDRGGFAPLPFSTGAIIAYEAPAKRLGGHIIFRRPAEPRVVLPTYHYRGERGIALMTLMLEEDFKPEERGSLRIEVPENRIVPVEDFPAASGWYCQDAATTVPSGPAVGPSAEARFLWRQEGPYVGPLVRDIYPEEIHALYSLFARFGVAVEMNGRDEAKYRGMCDFRPEHVLQQSRN